jgi:2,3-dihydroxybenzoate decarboxylase
MATARTHRCDYIALEEAFFIPELAERQPMPHLGCLAQLPYRLKTESAERFQRGLPDFTEYRLPEMDDVASTCRCCH